MPPRENTCKIKTLKYLISISLLVLYGISTTTGVAASEATQPERSLPLTRQLSEVGLIYYRNFLYSAPYHYQPTPECVFLPGKTGNRQKPRVLRCTEHINLLLPTAEANSWNREQEQQGYINLHTKQMTANYVNPNIHAHIILIKPTSITTEKFSHRANTYPATALFIRHALNIRTYRFRNLQTGTISAINATDDHPFYSKSKSAFIPIGSASASDTLITETGEPIKLICSKKGKKHCGIPYKNGQLAAVYNIETYPKHTYFAGNENQILVHNCSRQLRHPVERRSSSSSDQGIQFTPDEEEQMVPYDPSEGVDTQATPHHTEKNPPNKSVQIVLAEDVPDRRTQQEIEDGISYSLDDIENWTSDNHTMSAFTQARIAHLKDPYGNKATISDLLSGRVEQDPEGRFVISRPTDYNTPADRQSPQLMDQPTDSRPPSPGSSSAYTTPLMQSPQLLPRKQDIVGQ